MTDRFDAFRQKMKQAELNDAAIRAFERNFRALERNETGIIPESTITPVADLPHFADLPPVDDATFTALLWETVVIKLNGGLGTGMGLEKAKSLLEVRDGLTFLDLIAKQILHLRQKTGGAAPRFLLMNSFSTSADTKAALAKFPALGSPETMELLQNRVPKVDVDSLKPAEFPQNPNLEWCPPGHGDIYPSLVGSGKLDELLAAGVKYAFVSNSDNLGADLDPRLLAWFARSGLPFVMEVTRRTLNDSKGGHLARRTADGRLILRESAQCASEDKEAFENIDLHRYFNTNNLWIRLDDLEDLLFTSGGSIALPLIRNRKTLDPRDDKSPAVYQLETAMGAAIETFPNAAAIEVPRDRFVPVKSTADLLVNRSNACELTPDWRIRLHPSRDGVPPCVELDGPQKRIDGLEFLIAHGIPDLLNCQKLTLKGPWQFAPGVTVKGTVTFENDTNLPRVIEPGTYGE